MLYEIIERKFGFMIVFKNLKKQYFTISFDKNFKP